MALDSVSSQQSRKLVREAGVKRISSHSEPSALARNIREELAAPPRISRKIELNGRNNLNKTITCCREEIISKGEELIMKLKKID